MKRTTATLLVLVGCSSDLPMPTGPADGAAPGGGAGDGTAAGTVGGADPLEPNGPFAPTTPSDSDRAKPEWAAFWGYAPQTAEGRELYDGRSDARGPIDGGLLVCRAHTATNSDLLTLPDLSIEVALGDAPLLRAHTEGGSLDAYFTVPLARARNGDKVRFAFFDSDVQGRDALGTVHGRVEALPLSLASGDLSVSCGRVQPELFEVAYARQLAKLDEALAAIKSEPPQPRLTDTDWGFDQGGFGAARRQLGELAGLVGWAHPMVIHRRTLLERRSSEFQVPVNAQRDAWRKGPEPGTPQLVGDGWVEITVTRRECGDAAVARHLPDAGMYEPQLRASRCVIELELVNRGGRPVETKEFMFGFGPVNHIWLDAPFPRRAFAWPIRLSKDGRAVEQAMVAPGEKVSLLLTPEVPVDLDGSRADLPQASLLIVDVWGNALASELGIRDYRAEALRLR